MRIAPIALLSLLVAGCGSSGSSTVTESGKSGSATATATATPPNVVTSKFSLTIPSDWIALDLEKMDSTAVKAKLKGTMFEVQAPQIEQMRSMVGFFAFDEANSKSPQFANFNVVMMPSPGAAKDILEANRKQLTSMDAGAKEITGLTKLPDSLALKYSMFGMEMLGVITVQNGNQVVLTYTAPKGTDVEKMKKIVAPIADSFKLK